MMRLARCLRSLVLASAVGLLAVLSAAAQTPNTLDLAELEQLQTLSQRNSAEAVQAL